VTVLLGTVAAVLFGVGDLIAGVGGRRDANKNTPSGIALTASLVGALISGLYLLMFRTSGPVTSVFTGNDIWWSLAAGLIMSAARPLLYLGMTRGPIMVFAPVFSLVALVVPAVVAPLVGQSLAGLEVVGVIIALPAVVLVSSNKRLPTMSELKGSSIIGLAVAVGTSVGVGGLFLSFVSEGAGAAPAFVLATAGLVVIPVVARGLGQSVIPNKTALVFGGIVGTTSIIAIILSTITYQRGGAAIGSALIGLSPGVSILLAWRFLKERIWPIQAVGGLLGIVTVVLFALAGS
jgi:drug/metabolite transporter (DMT)-like permease